MSLCTLIYNSAGNDTDASGSNLPTTAHTDTTLGQTVSGTTATTTMTFSGTINLTGVGGDSSGDVIFVPTAAGERQLFRILTYTGGVSTCTGLALADTIGATTITALGWAIGGKRASFIWDDLGGGTFRADFEDGSAGWIFEFEGTGTEYSAVGANPIDITAPGTVADGPMVIRAATGATPVIDWTDGQHLFERVTGGGDLDIIGMTIQNDTSISPGARMFEGSSFGALRITDCDLSCWGDIIQFGDGRLVCLNTDFHPNAGLCIKFEATRWQAHIQKCIFRGSTGKGISIGSSQQQGGFVFVSNIVRDFGSNGLEINADAKHLVVSVLNNVFEGNSGDGVSITGTTNVDGGPIVIMNNIFTNNTQYGIASDAGDISGAMLSLVENYNAFYNNTSGETLNIDQGANDVTLTADPYTAIGSDDYTLNATAGGGAACKDAGYGYNG